VLQPTAPQNSVHVYEVRPRSDKRGVDLISDALPFGRLWYGESNAVSNAIAYAEHYSRAHDAVIRVYDTARNVIETHEHAGDFQFRILLSFQFSPFASKCSRSMRRAS
jgi:hypothetical protein